MKVSEILALAQANGAQAGSPYEKGLTVASNVEGTVSAGPNGGWRLSVKDDSGELTMSIASTSYKPERKAYDIVVATATRDVIANNNQVIARKGDKRLRAM